MRDYRYAVMALMAVMAIINYVDRGAISYASGPITAEFGLDKAAWGAVLGYFGYGYMVGALFGGALADARGPKWMWVVSGTAWSVLEIGMVFAGQFGVAVLGGSALLGFAVFRVLFGLAEGPAFATINRSLAVWAAPRERGIATGLGLLGTPLGALLTAPIAVALLSIGSWRVMFVLLGSLGLLWVVVWIRVFTDRPQDNPRVGPPERELLTGGTAMPTGKPLGRESWRLFFGSRTLIANTIGFFAFLYVNFLLLTWTPKYLEDEFGFKLSSLWYLGMVPWIGACVTVLLGGRLSDWLAARTGDLRIARSWLAVASLALTGAVFLCIPLVHSPAAVLALIAVGNALNFLPDTVYWAVVVDVAAARAGTFSGIMHFFANIATILAPTLTGVLVADHGYGAMFVGAGIACVVGMVAMVFVNPRAKVDFRPADPVVVPA
ncbi:MFS transporter [Lentzea sp. NBRC 105346]|uniref:MFS transporter n=1 Tax=Lentzea sp. NBRC 105346 TaxID=3032205 RepID=UPI0024A03167|nr:MFS transporter [Lentzea sp. NBRC 105346]GLZ35000.1 MFS transporter [Lentzea sp. NBRC 105346]